MRATAFVSGPYSPLPYIKSDVVDNISTATDCAIWLWEHDFSVICPHLNTKFFDNLTDQPKEAFLDFYLSIIRSGVVDLIVLLPNWQSSEGTSAEFQLARRLYIPTYTWEPDCLSLTRK